MFLSPFWAMSIICLASSARVEGVQASSASGLPEDLNLSQALSNAVVSPTMPAPVLLRKRFARGQEPKDCWLRKVRDNSRRSRPIALDPDRKRGLCGIWVRVL